MKRYLIGMVLAVALFAMAGCGGGDDHVDLFETVIPSDAAVDGHIFQPDNGGARTVSPVGSNVLVGLSDTGEYRGFLSFPLDAIPLEAVIRSATLTVTLIPPVDDIPIEMDLVSFSPTVGLIESYYAGLTAYASARYTLPVPNINNEISFNVTSLVAEAQRRAFDDFQLRIMEDLDFDILGLLEISESSLRHPRLTILYSL